MHVYILEKFYVYVLNIFVYDIIYARKYFQNICVFIYT